MSLVGCFVLQFSDLCGQKTAPHHGSFQGDCTKIKFKGYLWISPFTTTNLKLLGSVICTMSWKTWWETFTSAQLSFFWEKIISIDTFQKNIKKLFSIEPKLPATETLFGFRPRHYMDLFFLAFSSLHRVQF